MPTKSKSINQDNISSTKNDELQSSPQMKLFETEFVSIEKQIIHLEKMFKQHLAIIASLIEEIENK